MRATPCDQSLEQGTGSIKLSRILLLDDESEIVELCANVLRKNYLVVKTNSPFEAVSFMDAGRHMIDLVICDYTMPGMNGAEFVDKIRNHGVTTPVILYTGRVADWAPREFDKFVKILEKPFGGEKLLSEVAGVLAAIQRESDVYKRFRGIIPHLNISLKNLEIFLKGRGIENPTDINPQKALKKFGTGEAYNIFLSWHYLHELRSKIGP
jgi:CheY-like chemotaxis protein